MTGRQHPLYNPNAGSYPLPTDKREIAAVLRSVDRCYDLHPYLAWRYGAYGEAFTRSDGGYLTTLSGHAQSHVTAQALWVGEMLACRGMPRLFVELHLDLLYEELMAEIPGRAPRYRKLQRAAEALRNARHRWIGADDGSTLAQSFDRTAGGAMPNAGILIVTAVCDEAWGIGKAVPSLMSWLADPGRFSRQWCDAATDTLRQARALTGNAPGTPPVPGAVGS
ncbi:MAG: hypothetical protein F8N37_11830 [Telmatospirillum sp.]|nr:hypothetical protein [Telmatospirillum sp.]